MHQAIITYHNKKKTRYSFIIIITVPSKLADVFYINSL